MRRQSKNDWHEPYWPKFLYEKINTYSCISSQEVGNEARKKGKREKKHAKKKEKKERKRVGSRQIYR